MNSYRLAIYWPGLPVRQPDGSLNTAEQLQVVHIIAPNPWAAMRRRFDWVDVVTEYGHFVRADAYAANGLMARVLVYKQPREQRNH